MKKLLYVRPQNDKSKQESKMWNRFESDLLCCSNSIANSAGVYYYSAPKSVLDTIYAARDVAEKSLNLSYNLIVMYGYNRLVLFIGLLKFLKIIKSDMILLEFAYEGQLSTLKKIILKILLNRFSIIGVCSDSEIERYSKEIKIDKIKFRNVPAPIENDYFDCSNINKKTSGYILSAGKGYRDYNILIQAASILSSYSFIIVSDKQSMEGIKNIPDNVEIHYNINRDDYFRLLKDAFIVVVPIVETNRSAGHQVIYQAMATFKPVITTKTNTTKEFIEHNVNGLLVNEGNHDDIVESIIYLHNNKDKYISIAKAGFLTAQGYTLTSYYICLKDIIDSL